MADLSEEECRAICEALGLEPDALGWMTGCKQCRRRSVVSISRTEPVWRIVQRAASSVQERKEASDGV